MVRNGFVGFICNGAILPRSAGDKDTPLQSDAVICFQSPESLSITFNLPNRGAITGMGIKKGVTLFVGGGFHGKSTVLQALEVGVYNHIPGDGREFVAVDRNAVKIRAEDSRWYVNVLYLLGFVAVTHELVFTAAISVHLSTTCPLVVRLSHSPHRMQVAVHPKLQI